MRAGVALPTVLLLLALTSALVVAGAFVTRQLTSRGLTTDRSAALEPAVENALSLAVAEWDSVARSAQTIGSVNVLAVSSFTGIRADVWITRLGPRTYWLVAESRDDRRPPVQRRIGLIVRVTKGIAELVPDRPWAELP